MRAPTMRDVAMRAGVGVGTVSRVVNGGASVSPRTAARVQAAIAELGFRRNDIARALRPGMTANTIALLVGDLTNPFYATIAKVAVEVAREAGFAVIVTMVDEDPAEEYRVVQDLLSRRISGMIIVPDRGNHDFMQVGLDSGIPTVFVDRPPSGISADVVLLDNERGGALAADHLLQHGHRRVAALVAPSYYTTGMRMRGFRRALRAAGAELDPALSLSLAVGSADAAYLATTQLLAGPDAPTAIFATTNFVCEGTLRAVDELHARVAVVGFDDFRLADMLPTPATVVSGDVAEMGRRAAEILLRRAAGDDSAVTRTTLPVSLTARGSGEIEPPVSRRRAAPARRRPSR